MVGLIARPVVVALGLLLAGQSTPPTLALLVLAGVLLSLGIAAARLPLPTPARRRLELVGATA